jgi:hypothetical protein
MTDTITLTREQFVAILDQADLAVSFADELCNLREGLAQLGLAKAADTIGEAQDQISECRNEITRTMIAADDAQPLPVKLRAYANWFRLFNKSNREA